MHEVKGEHSGWVKTQLEVKGQKSSTGYDEG